MAMTAKLFGKLVSHRVLCAHLFTGILTTSIAFAECKPSPAGGGSPTRQTKQPLSSAKRNFSPQDSPRNDGDNRETRPSNPFGGLLGAALNVANQASQAATSGLKEEAILGVIEAAADGLRAGVENVDKTLPPLDPQIAQEFGNSFRRSIVAKHGRINDQRTRDLVMPIWDELVRASGESAASLKVTLVRDSENNAFAFVGRNVVVNQGFINFAERCDKTRDVIRFVLAHEIGHIVCGHTDTLLRRVVAAEQFLPGASVAPTTVEAIIKQTPIRQSEEREADCFARRIHVANNWSLEGSREFFTRLESTPNRRENAVTIESLFRSHPDMKRRLQLIESGAGCPGN